MEPDTEASTAAETLEGGSVRLGTVGLVVTLGSAGVVATLMFAARLVPSGPPSSAMPLLFTDRGLEVRF